MKYGKTASQEIQNMTRHANEELRRKEYVI